MYPTLAQYLNTRFDILLLLLSLKWSSPDGLGRVTLYLYSKYGVHVPDIDDDVPSLRNRRFSIELAMGDNLFKDMTISALETHAPIIIDSPQDSQITHLILSMHGSRPLGTVTLYNTKLSKRMTKGPEDFAVYLHQQLREKFDTSVTTLETILFDSCEVGRCSGEGHTDSFVDLFYDKAKGLFPNLKEVIASPYITVISGCKRCSDDKALVSIQLLQNEEDVYNRVSFSMEAKEFFRDGFKYQENLFMPPSKNTVSHVVFKEESTGRLRFRKGAYKETFFNRPSDSIERKPDFFSQPAFRRIQIERASGGSAVTPRIKTPSVDLPPRI